MSQCRLEMIRDGKQVVPRSCQLCGLFNRCQKFLDQPSPPKPTAESRVEAQAAEIDRLKAELELRDKVIEQAIEFAGIRITEDRVMIHSLVPVSVFPGEGGFPELYAHLAGRGSDA